MHRKLSTINKSLCFVAGLLLFSVTIGDVHSHLCLDGQEPLFSAHFENLSGHPDHEDDELDHNDYEFEFSVETLLVKAVYVNVDFVVNLFSVPLPSISGQQYFVPTPVESFVQKESASFLPLLRAPPVVIA